MYNFDQLLDRRGTACVKWDVKDLFGVGPEGELTPMWIADKETQATRVYRLYGHRYRPDHRLRYHGAHRRSGWPDGPRHSAGLHPGGAKFLAETAGEVKDAGKTVPRAMILSTVIVAVFYALIGVVASGVLPLDQVAFQPLTLVAQTIFPAWLYYFFVIGGALFALATTLNGTLSWVTRGLQLSAQDGWLPEICAKENKGGTPVVLLLVFYVVGAIPVLTGMDTTTIAIIVFVAVLVVYTIFRWKHVQTVQPKV